MGATVGVLAIATAAHGDPAGRSGPVVLGAGQTRWFAPGELRTGQPIQCTVGPSIVTASVPAASPGGIIGGVVFADTVSKKGASILIQRKPNGATQVTCGSGPAAGPRPALLPYVIGPNGLGRIRGPNQLGALSRVFGPPSLLRAGQPGVGRCTARWRTIGLSTTFGRPACHVDAVMIEAVVTGPAWSTLTGTRIGDPVGKMRWLQPVSRPVSATRSRSVWLLGASRRTPFLSLYATARSGRVTAFALRR